VQTVRPDNRQSWMAPDAKKHDLLYIGYSTGGSNNERELSVYSYPDLGKKGTLQVPGPSPYATLQGFVQRQSRQRLGDCELRREIGDGRIRARRARARSQRSATRVTRIWTVRSIQRRAISRSRTITRVTGPRTAVASIPWVLATWRSTRRRVVSRHTTTFHAWGIRISWVTTPTADLFVDGIAAGSCAFADFWLDERPKGKHHVQANRNGLENTSNTPGGVQWDGYLAVGDDQNNTIHQIDPATGKIVSTTSVTLVGPSSPIIGQFTIHGHTLIMPALGTAVELYHLSGRRYSVCGRRYQRMGFQRLAGLRNSI